MPESRQEMRFFINGLHCVFVWPTACVLKNILARLNPWCCQPAWASCTHQCPTKAQAKSKSIGPSNLEAERRHNEHTPCKVLSHIHTTAIERRCCSKFGADSHTPFTSFLTVTRTHTHIPRTVLINWLARHDPSKGAGARGRQMQGLR